MKVRNSLVFLVLMAYVAGCGLFGTKKDAKEKATAKDKKESSSAKSDTSMITVTVPGEEAQKRTAMAPIQSTPTDQNYVINELTFEVKKLAAEVKHLQNGLQEMQSKSQMWMNPLSMYDKEIVMDNGSSFFGKIIYQDEKIVKIETVIGYIVLQKPNIVRVITNVPEKPTDQYLPDEVAVDIKSSSPVPQIVPPTYTTQTGEPSKLTDSPSRIANCVLIGNVKENKDRTGNTIFTGEVKNIGSRRADFVKINFIFRKNWSGETDTKTAFVEGSYYTFEGSGITTNNSLLPGASGTFQLIIQKSFGAFIGYSYSIEWEQYK